MQICLLIDEETTRANVARFLKFIDARESVRVRKDELCMPPPYTRDPILAKFRFCNVDRNDDTVTRWIHKNYIQRFLNSESLWFMLVMGRVFNNPGTLEDLMFNFDGVDLGTTSLALKNRKADGLRVFNPAYIVSTNGKAMDKIDYIVNYVLAPVYANRERIPREKTCLRWFDFLSQHDGLGDFMANQIVTDMRYSRYLPRATTPDWTTFVRPGPGTKRGLARIFADDVNAKVPAEFMQQALAYLQHTAIRYFSSSRKLPKTFEDPNNISNCLCEFDKYERARKGEGYPKQLYTPKA